MKTFFCFLRFSAHFTQHGAFSSTTLRWRLPVLFLSPLIQSLLQHTSTTIQRHSNSDVETALAFSACYTDNTAATTWLWQCFTLESVQLSIDTTTVPLKYYITFDSIQYCSAPCLGFEAGDDYLKCFVGLHSAEDADERWSSSSCCKLRKLFVSILTWFVACREP